MFGVSFLEIALIGLVALVVVGPQKLPEMMRTAGEWVGKLRRMTADMRAQTGIDDILREEGIDGVRELRTLLRGERGVAARRALKAQEHEAYSAAPDPALEFPVEGPDSYGALSDDLVADDIEPTPEGSPSDDLVLVERSPAPPAKSSVSIPSPPPAPRVITKNSLPSSLPQSIPPPPATPRPSPPRAVTHRETPHSKSEPKITISEPPAPNPRPAKPSAKPPSRS